MKPEKQNRNALMAGSRTVKMLLCAALVLFAAFAAGNLILGLWSAFQPAESFVLFAEGHPAFVELHLLWTQRLSAEYLLPSAAEQAKTVYEILFWSNWLKSLLAAAVLWELRTIFRNIDLRGTPFLPENACALRNIGLLVILLPLLPAAMRILLFSLTGLLQGWYWDGEWLTYLFVGVLILCLSRIFAYGCTLQQESDETI